MKSLLKRSLRALWRSLAPVHRPLLRKLDGRFSRLVEAAVRPLVVGEFERRIHPALDATTAVVREHVDRNEDAVEFLRRTAQENTLLLDSLVRELVRVQMQLEALDESVADRSSRDDVDPADPFAPIRETTPAERLMIG
jgi:hypothetical protein